LQLSWQRYSCATACKNATAKECFNEGLIRDTADAMVALGYKGAGWEYVNLDDCWQAAERVDGRVVAHPLRFPSGIKALADVRSHPQQAPQLARARVPIPAMATLSKRPS
jgi:hypothetical protein